MFAENGCGRCPSGSRREADTRDTSAPSRDKASVRDVAIIDGRPARRDRRRELGFGCHSRHAICLRPLGRLGGVSQASEHAQRVGIETQNRMRAAEQQNAVSPRLADRRILRQFASRFGERTIEHAIEIAVPHPDDTLGDEAKAVGPVVRRDGTAAPSHRAKHGERCRQNGVGCRSDSLFEELIRREPIGIVGEICDLLPQE